MILVQFAVGFLTVVFAIDENFAEGKVAFDAGAWKVVFGAVGVFITYRSARALMRTINGTTIELTPEHFRRARLNGTLLELIGIGLLVAVWSEDIARRTIAFDSWAKPLYIVGGILLVLTGLVQWMKPAGTPRQGNPPSLPIDPNQYSSSNE